MCECMCVCVSYRVSAVCERVSLSVCVFVCDICVSECECE